MASIFDSKVSTDIKTMKKRIVIRASAYVTMSECVKDAQKRCIYSKTLHRRRSQLCIAKSDLNVFHVNIMVTHQRVKAFVHFADQIEKEISDFTEANRFEKHDASRPEPHQILRLKKR